MSTTADNCHYSVIVATRRQPYNNIKKTITHESHSNTLALYEVRHYITPIAIVQWRPLDDEDHNFTYYDHIWGSSEYHNDHYIKATIISWWTLEDSITTPRKPLPVIEMPRSQYHESRCIEAMTLQWRPLNEEYHNFTVTTHKGYQKSWWAIQESIITILWPLHKSLYNWGH
jgi:hypothetical protein